VKCVENRLTLLITELSCEAGLRTRLGFNGYERTAMTLPRCTRKAKLDAGLALSDDRCKAFYDWFDRSESTTLSLAIICKSACAFPSAATVRSDFSKRRLRRSFSAMSRLFSAASGFAGRPRLDLFTVVLPSRCFRQWWRSELWMPRFRITAARSSGVVAASYSSRIVSR
jgi:hypothetical protein